MTAHRFYTVDAFTKSRFNGAQIAVFPSAKLISAEQRQAIAQEFAVSETVFLSPEHDGFNIDVYTPQAPAGFGSHTTLAAACALEADEQLAFSGAEAPINFYHKQGVYAANLSRPAGLNQGLPFVRITLSTDPIVDNYVPNDVELADILSLDEADIGNRQYQCKLSSNLGLYLVVPVRSLDAARKARLNHDRWLQSQAPQTLAQTILLVTEDTEQTASDFHLRLLGTQIGVHEDPPVGSTIPAFAAFLCAHPHLKNGTYCYSVERGVSSHRQSIIEVEMDHKGKDTLNLRLGGSGIIMSKGEMYTSHLQAVKV